MCVCVCLSVCVNIGTKYQVCTKFCKNILNNIKAKGENTCVDASCG